jgi:hypothetical protein
MNRLPNSASFNTQKAVTDPEIIQPYIENRILPDKQRFMEELK